MLSRSDEVKLLHVLNYATIPSIREYLTRLALRVGDYKMSAQHSDFNGWLLCDGRSVSRTDFPELFKVVATSFGATDSNSFNLPDLRGRVYGGCGSNIAGLTNRSLGTAVGSETHTLTTAEMPLHTHSATASNAGGHTHTVNNSGLHSHSVTDPGHTHTQTTINDDYNNSGTNPPGFTADSAGTITWNNINTAYTNVTVNSNGDHVHTMNTAGDHTHSITIASTGSGDAHNIMQPTLFAGYMYIYSGVYVTDIL